jgi:hypothetical protein
MRSLVCRMSCHRLRLNTLLWIVLALSTWSPRLSAEVLIPDFGDLNCDGVTNVIDVQFAIISALGFSVDPLLDQDGDGLPDGCQEYAAAISGDCEVGEVIKWTGQVWACATDLTGEGAGVLPGGSVPIDLPEGSTVGGKPLGGLTKSGLYAVSETAVVQSGFPGVSCTAHCSEPAHIALTGRCELNPSSGDLYAVGAVNNLDPALHAGWHCVGKSFEGASLFCEVICHSP